MTNATKPTNATHEAQSKKPQHTPGLGAMVSAIDNAVAALRDRGLMNDGPAEMERAALRDRVVADLESAAVELMRLTTQRDAALGVLRELVDMADEKVTTRRTHEIANAARSLVADGSAR